MKPIEDSVGDVLREWRGRRRLSQLHLACDAQISTRHLSFIESGRAAASRDVLLRLAERLTLPPRARNRLMLAAGYAPMHTEQSLEAPGMEAIHATVAAVLTGHLPFPALAVDRHWTLVMANAAVETLLAGVAPELRTPPVNVLRLSLHPDGLSSAIVNLLEWRHHILDRLRVQIEASGDPVLVALQTELAGYRLPQGAGGSGERGRTGGKTDAVAVPLELRDAASGMILRFLSTTTVFGTAQDVTLSELSLECFYPADAATRAALLGAFMQGEGARS